MVFSDPDSAKTLVAFSEIYKDEPRLRIISSEEVPPRKAYKLAPSGANGPTSLMNLARENSLIQENRIAILQEEVKRGEEVSRILDRLHEHLG
jgi:hypothetical protein